MTFNLAYHRLGDFLSGHSYSIENFSSLALGKADLSGGLQECLASPSRSGWRKRMDHST